MNRHGKSRNCALNNARVAKKVRGCVEICLVAFYVLGFRLAKRMSGVFLKDYE